MARLREGCRAWLIHIEPSNPYLVLGASLQLRAVLPSGKAAGVFWRMDEAAAGT